VKLKNAFDPQISQMCADLKNQIFICVNRRNLRIDLSFFA